VAACSILCASCASFPRHTARVQERLLDIARVFETFSGFGNRGCLLALKHPAQALTSKDAKSNP
jgi:hypothetical protein